MPLPYGDGQEYVAQYDHMPGGEYTLYVRYYGVGCVNGEIILQAAAALWEPGAEPQETATPWPTSTRLVPPSPTPRATRSVATPTRSGASNLDAIIDEGTLTIGWVGPALFSTLFAAFAWATGVFQWLWSPATWLFSGAWRGGS
jgi:hypothetical protein